MVMRNKNPNEHSFEETVLEILNPNCLKDPPLEPFSRAGLQSYKACRIFGSVGKQNGIVSSEDSSDRSEESDPIITKPNSSFITEKSGFDFYPSSNHSDGPFPENHTLPHIISDNIHEKRPDSDEQEANSSAEEKYVHNHSDNDLAIFAINQDTVQAPRSRKKLTWHPQAITKIVRGLITCPSYDKPLFLRAINQLAYQSLENSLQLVAAPRLIEAVFHALNLAEDTTMEALILLTNLAASSPFAAERIGRFEGLFDTAISLCASGSPSLTLRALGALNAVTRQVRLHLSPSQAAALEAVRSRSARMARRDSLASATMLLAACVTANTMVSVQRRKWRAEPLALSGAAEIVRRSLSGKPLAGITCAPLDAIASAGLLACSPHNRAALVALGVVDPVVQVLTGWSDDDADGETGRQLGLLESCLRLLLSLAAVPGAGQAMASLRLGPRLSQLVEARPGETAVDLSKALMRAMLSSPPAAEGRVATNPFCQNLRRRAAVGERAAHGAQRGSSESWQLACGITAVKTMDSSPPASLAVPTWDNGTRHSADVVTSELRPAQLIRKGSELGPEEHFSCDSSVMGGAVPKAVLPGFRESSGRRLVGGWDREKASNCGPMKELLAGAGDGAAFVRRRNVPSGSIRAGRARGRPGVPQTTIGSPSSPDGNGGAWSSPCALPGRIMIEAGPSQEWAWRSGGCWRSGPVTPVYSEPGITSKQRVANERPATGPAWAGTRGQGVRYSGEIECVGLPMLNDVELDRRMWASVIGDQSPATGPSKSHPQDIPTG